MKITEMFLGELTSECERTKRAFEQYPEGQDEWKPHEKSMPLGYLASLIAIIPSWVAMIVTQDELDVASVGLKHEAATRTRAGLLQMMEKASSEARTALDGTTDEFLDTPWRMLAGGEVVMKAARHVMIRDAFNHLAHHRGQLTVYLRLLGATVPALYGPSADDKRFL